MACMAKNINFFPSGTYLALQVLEDRLNPAGTYWPERNLKCFVCFGIGLCESVFQVSKPRVMSDREGGGKKESSLNVVNGLAVVV